MLEILYQDKHLIAINKPAGLLVHRSMIDRHETQFALQMVRNQIGQHVYPLHRLDKPTSGVLIFALDPDIARKMMAVFAAWKMKKEYLAIVRGHTEVQTIIDYALKEELDKMTDRQAGPDKEAQIAITEYQRLATIELPHAVGRYPTARYSLIKALPQTGRKHQIRRHMKHAFHPIVGDTTHGDGKHNQLFRDQFNCHRLLLHAAKLTFKHPLSSEILSISAPLDSSFLQAVELFKLDMKEI